MTSHPYLRLVADDADLAIDADSDLLIDCDRCVKQHSDACDDCMVSYLVGHEAGTPVVLDSEEQHAVELLSDAGLVPENRYAPRPGVA